MKVEPVHIGVAGRKLKFLPLTAADAELVDAPVTDQIMAAAQHTGVAQLRAEVIIPQVGVGVKMDDVQIGIFAHGCAHGTQGHKMLAAEQQRQLAVPQDLGRAGFDVHKGSFPIEPKQSSKSPLSKTLPSVRSLS